MDQRETLFKGWLVKSPPFQPSVGGSSIFRRPQPLQPRWRRRYFVLSCIRTEDRSSNYLLTYYEDELQTKRKGRVDLEHANNITTHVIPPTYLLNKLQPRLLRAPADQTPFFLLETVHRRQMRTYYFLPESSTQMERWVSHLSNACGLGEDDLSGINDSTIDPSYSGQFPPLFGASFQHVQQLQPLSQNMLSPSGRYIPGDSIDGTIRSLHASTGRFPLNSSIRRPTAQAPEDDYRMPPTVARGGGNPSNEDDYRMPPRTDEDDYRLPPPHATGQSLYKTGEDEYRLPPVASDHPEFAEDDYRLPPPLTGNAPASTDEDAYRLPPQQQQQQSATASRADPDASQYINLANTSTRVSVDRIEFFNNNNNSSNSIHSGGVKSANVRQQQTPPLAPPVPSRRGGGESENGSSDVGGGGVDYINVTKLSRVYSLRRTQSPSPSRAPQPQPQPRHQPEPIQQQSSTPAAVPESIDEPEPLLLPRRRSDRGESAAAGKTGKPAALAASESSLADSDEEEDSDDAGTDDNTSTDNNSTVDAAVATSNTESQARLTGRSPTS